MTRSTIGKAALTKTDPNEGQGGVLGKAATAKKLGEFSSFFFKFFKTNYYSNDMSSLHSTTSNVQCAV